MKKAASSDQEAEEWVEWVEAGRGSRFVVAELRDRWMRLLRERGAAGRERGGRHLEGEIGRVGRGGAGAGGSTLALRVGDGLADGRDRGENPGSLGYSTRSCLRSCTESRLLTQREGDTTFSERVVSGLNGLFRAGRLLRGLLGDMFSFLSEARASWKILAILEV